MRIACMQALDRALAQAAAAMLFRACCCCLDAKAGTAFLSDANLQPLWAAVPQPQPESTLEDLRGLAARKLERLAGVALWDQARGASFHPIQLYGWNSER